MQARNPDFVAAYNAEKQVFSDWLEKQDDFNFYVQKGLRKYIKTQSLIFEKLCREHKLSKVAFQKFCQLFFEKLMELPFASAYSNHEIRNRSADEISQTKLATYVSTHIDIEQIFTLADDWLNKKRAKNDVLHEQICAEEKQYADELDKLAEKDIKQLQKELQQARDLRRAEEELRQEEEKLRQEEKEQKPVMQKQVVPQPGAKPRISTSPEQLVQASKPSNLRPSSGTQAVPSLLRNKDGLMNDQDEPRRVPPLAPQPAQQPVPQPSRQTDDDKEYTLAEKMTALGSFVGASGAVIGGAAGLPAGPFGVLAGALIGFIVGAFVGFAAGAISHAISRCLYPQKSTPRNPQPVSQNVPEDLSKGAGSTKGLKRSFGLTVSKNIVNDPAPTSSQTPSWSFPNSGELWSSSPKVVIKTKSQSKFSLSPGNSY